MDVKKLAEHSSTSMEVSLLQYISILRKQRKTRVRLFDYEILHAANHCRWIRKGERRRRNEQIFHTLEKLERMHSNVLTRVFSLEVHVPSVLASKSIHASQVYHIRVHAEEEFGVMKLSDRRLCKGKDLEEELCRNLIA
ncbi:hypothetical protein V6N11_059643 [Hibiscus sabdariffa]|uniref:Uncharacterized protein n=1 Tax=Hibiscus sabdariffa TaxID=183260 RepID=A0ABR2NXP0_9ROSI